MSHSNHKRVSKGHPLKIYVSKRIAQEIAQGVEKGVCGHPMELGKEASKVWRRMVKNKFFVELVVSDETQRRD